MKRFNFINAIEISGVARIFFRGGNILGGRPRGGSGGRSPPDAGEFSKFFKKFLKKIAKNALFWPIFNQILKTLRYFLRIWTNNTNCWEILRQI